MNGLKIHQIQHNLCLGLMTLILINLTACNMSGTISTPTPEPTPVTILVDSETIILVPGENIAPLNYDLIIEDPEFSSRVDWEFINGLWEPLAPGVDIPIDICQVNFLHPDCVGMRSPTPTALPGVLEELQSYTDPSGRFVFDYPASWYTLSVSPDPADGVQVLDAPTLEEATQWISFDVFPNPEQLSLPAWFEAGHGQVWAGQVTEEQEEVINEGPALSGVTVLRQRLENNAPTVGEPYVYSLIWMPAGKYIVLWTAWPGEQPETLNLLERMVTGFRSYE